MEQPLYMRIKFGNNSGFRIALDLCIILTVIKKCSEGDVCTLETELSAIKADQDQPKDVNA